MSYATSIEDHAYNISLLPRSPTKSKATAQKIFRHSTKPKTNTALKAILKVGSIALPPAVTPKYNECKQSPSKFWISTGVQLDLERNRPIENLVSQVYLGITSLETQSQWDTILWRYFVLFFHDLVTWLGISGLTAKFQDHLVATVLAAPGPVFDDDANTIQENLKRWTACGSRYTWLSASLDNGALFLLPQCVTDRT